MLEAAHIRPHAEQPDYSVSNGLLLKADIHTLYGTQAAFDRPTLHRSLGAVDTVFRIRSPAWSIFALQPRAFPSHAKPADAGTQAQRIPRKTWTRVALEDDGQSERRSSAGAIPNSQIAKSHAGKFFLRNVADATLRVGDRWPAGCWVFRWKWQRRGRKTGRVMRAWTPDKCRPNAPRISDQYSIGMKF